ncbi:MAG: HAD-IIIA family hydrolase [Proteobacteria bacterium]|nr:HAD-IIIA family hydrolase [Pseudomonadota bacterium]MBU1710023.1 HAD-IIIA family hydrolase [Pseudomonadota bacterium]
MPDDTCSPSGTSYPSDCDITQGLREKAFSRKHSDERSYLWRSCLPRAKQIKLLLLDVDGVLTDGTITYTHGGDEIKSFHTRDGLGLRLLQEAGVEVGIITARTSEAVTRRARDLSLKYVFQGSRNKIEAYDTIISELKVKPEEIAYMGDDWLDLPILTRVGFAITVADGAAEVRNVAHFITSSPGGKGAVREVCDLIIEAKDMTQTLLEKYTHP